MLSTVIRPSERLPKKAPAQTQAQEGESLKIGRYAVVGELGRGGMGVVYKAYDTELRRLVALKLILDPARGGEELVKRFHLEASAVARLSHPAIVTVHEIGEHEGKPFLVMELVEGTSFESLLRREKVSPRRIAEIVREIALGLEHAHEKGILHRDVKPENILVSTAGRPSLTDFGLARDVAATAHLTVNGQILGTPAYMSPEQASGDPNKQDERTDVYALGGVLYRALVGRLPFTGSSFEAVINKVLHEEPLPPRAIAIHLHRDLETITLRCLAKEKDRRYPRAKDVAEDLRRFLDGESILARPVSKLEKAQLWVRRNRPLAAAGLAVLVLGAGALATAGAKLHERRARRLVVEEAIRLARSGKIETERAHGEVLDAVLRVSDARTMGVLGASLDEVTGELRSVRGAALRAAAQPTTDEERIGEKPIEGLDRALAKLDALDPAGTLDPVSASLLDQARKRLEDRAAEGRRTLQEREATVDLGALVASRETERLGAGGVELVALACDALGRSGVPDGVEPLGRYLALEADQRRATRAGEALARLGGARACRIVLAARSRLGPHGPFWKAVAPLLAKAVSEEAWPASAPRDLRDRGVVRAEVGDLPGAVQDLSRALEAAPLDARARSSRGDALGRAGAVEAALVDLEAAIVLSPDDASAWAARGELRFSTHALALAEADLTRAIELEPTNAAAWNRRGCIRGARDEAARAVSDFTRAIALDKDDAASWANRGGALLQKGDALGALADLTHAIDLDPRTERAFYYRGRAHFDRKAWDQAIADYDRAVELDPGDLGAWNERAVARREKGDLEGAIADFTKAIEKHGPRAMFLQNRGNAHMKKGDLEAAVEDYTKVIALEPGAPSVYSDRGTARMGLGDAQGALADFSKQLKREPNNFAALSNRGALRRDTGDLDGSLKDLTRAIEIDPKHPGPWVTRGATRSQKRDYEGAIADLTTAIAIAPEVPLAWNNRGCAYQSTGQLDKALADFDKALELAPRYVDAWCNRANTHRDRNELDEAIADATRALELAPTRASAWHSRGAAKQKKGDPDGAIEDLDRSIKLMPNFAPPLCFRGLAKRDKGDKDGARADLTRFLKMSPRSLLAPLAKEGLAKLDEP